MKVPHHCFFFVLFIVLCPDFMTKRRIQISSRIFPSVGKSEALRRLTNLPSSSQLLEQSGETYFSLNPVKSVFAAATSDLSGNEVLTPRWGRRSKSPRQRFRTSVRRLNRRRQKKTKNSVVDIEENFRGLNENPAPKIVQHRQRMEAIWNEIKSYERNEAEEACGTRWTRSENHKSIVKFQPHKTYGTLTDSTQLLDRNRRHATHITRVAEPSAVYFSGRYILKKPKLNFKSNFFTVELWVKPDGGQSNPAVILNGGLFISKRHFESKWTIGISSPNLETKPRYYFTTETKGGTPVTIYSPYAYKPEEWAHLAVSSGGGVFKLYVNAVQVGVHHDPREALFRRGVKSDAIILGGNEGMTQGYRGLVDKLVVWSGVRRQPDIRDDMYNLEVSHLDNDVVTSDEFDVFHNWELAGMDAPMIWNEDTPEQGHRSHFPEVTTPPCGQTICDNPSIVKSYVKHWTLRRPKALRYNVVNVHEDDGRRPMFTMDDVARQASLLMDAFGPHNITWVPTLVDVNNSRLRRKTVGCEASKIGNRQCDMECNHARMGFDGGDCDLQFSVCEESKRGNGHCEEDCNKLYHNWDLGDCCDPRYTDTDETCFDPNSPHRAYISIMEYKSGVGVNNSRQLNVLFANWSNPNSIGVATFPWDKEVFNSQGGTVVQLRPYTSREEMSGLVHELGHNLGLLHVHHGAHNVDCDDACVELQPSMTTGDLCEDTNPTPMNTNCDEPTLTQALCTIQNFTRTPYSNFMSYADGSCQDNFTPQQRARMHCYIDLFYSGWSEGANLAPIVLAPQVIASSTSQRFITISWAPPIDGHVVSSDRQCGSGCMPGKRLMQYAITARRPGSTEGDWSSNQATGPPDQVACALDGIHFWMPAWSESEFFDCETGRDKCSLDFEFENAVIPAKLRIWVSYGADEGDGIKSVELLHEDSSITVITGLHVSCEAPLSMHIFTKKLTRRIRVNVSYPYTAIDAVEMISDENEAACSGCRHVKYRIHREPPFPNGLIALTEQRQFTDKSCEEGFMYSYSVQPSLPPRLGEISPPVHFRLGQAFCGDGIIQTMDVNGPSEECDDGNTEDEDGCSSTCRTESGFHCKGEPSLCYWYEGDGECEEYERVSDTPDCAGTSSDVGTQWAIEASSSSEAMEALLADRESFSCRSTTKVLGPPDAQCIDDNGFWYPCSLGGLGELRGEHWIRVVFETSVVPSSVLIYLGPTAEDLHGYQEAFSILLPGGDVFSSGLQTLSCETNPVTIPLDGRLSVGKINHLVVKFSSQNTSIDAIGLTSSSEMASRECVMMEHYENTNVTCQITETLSAPGSLGTAWAHNTRCLIDCNRGYVPRSTQRITCRNGVWDSATECAPISCGAPSHVSFASFSCESGHKLNDICSFTCLNNARLVGKGNTFVCGEDGTWSVPAAQCKPTCGRPPIIDFSSSSCNEYGNRTSVPGETCKYRCRSGYHVTQQSSSRRSFRITCGVDGTWKGPGCQPVLCPPVPTMHKGRYSCTKGLFFGSVCTKVCPDSEKNETITCESSGSWSSSFSLCSDAVTSCEHPVGPNGVEIICDGLRTGKTCRASCVLRKGVPARDIVSLSDELVVDLDVMRNTRRILVCMGDRWSPNPEDLFCVEPCDPQLKGNGICDTQNNRSHCDWDGGDCCIGGNKRSPMSVSCSRVQNVRQDERIDWTRVKSTTPRTTNRAFYGRLHARTAKISMLEDGKRRKRRRRRKQASAKSRSGRDDSRKKHKNRKKHSGESRRRKRPRKSRG